MRHFNNVRCLVTLQIVNSECNLKINLRTDIIYRSFMQILYLAYWALLTEVKYLAAINF